MTEQTNIKHLLIIVHSRSGTNQALGQAVVEGARQADIEIRLKAPEEADENDLVVTNDQFRELGLKPITLAEGLMQDVTEIARRYAERADLSRIPCVSAWNQRRAKALESQARPCASSPGSPNILTA